MSSFTELLPPTKSESHGALTWEPVDDPSAPVCGLLTLTGKRAHTRYRVEEFPADFAGRAFVLLKEDGTDHYSVFIGKGTERHCDCRGYQSTGGCKHAAAILELLKANQI